MGDLFRHLKINIKKDLCCWCSWRGYRRGSWCCHNRTGNITIKLTINKVTIITVVVELLGAPRILTVNSSCIVSFAAYRLSKSLCPEITEQQNKYKLICSPEWPTASVLPRSSLTADSLRTSSVIILASLGS